MDLRRLLFLFAIAAAVSYGIRAAAFEGIYIATASMEPKLPVGAHVFTDKLTYLFRDPQRGEIIVFPSPENPKIEMVKRVIAIGGDTVEIRKKKVYLNGEPLDEPYAKYTRPDENLRGDDLGPITVPKLHVFVLGDNRDESNDSSVWKDGSGERIFFVKNYQIRGRIRGMY